MVSNGTSGSGESSQSPSERWSLEAYTSLTEQIKAVSLNEVKEGTGSDYAHKPRVDHAVVIFNRAITPVSPDKNESLT